MLNLMQSLFVPAGPKVTYIPPTPSEDEDAIFSHYKTGINFDKYDDILVDVSGTNPPPAIMVRSVVGCKPVNSALRCFHVAQTVLLLQMFHLFSVRALTRRRCVSP